MLLILKQKRLARAGALKALDFATTRSPANCERFVDQFGLRTIFAMFMGKCKVSALLKIPFLGGANFACSRGKNKRPTASLIAAKCSDAVDGFNLRIFV